MIKTLFLSLGALGAMALIATAQEVTVKPGDKVVIKTNQATVIRVTVNDEEIDFAGSPPRMSKRRVMVPLRGVFEKLGAYVEWRPEEQLVIATKGDKKIECWINKELAAIDGEQLKLEAPPMLVAGRTYVPLRFVSEALGAQVTWNKPASTVIIRIGD